MGVETIILLIVGATAGITLLVLSFNIMLYHAAYFRKHPHLMKMAALHCFPKGDEKPEDYDEFRTGHHTRYCIGFILLVVVMICLLKLT